MAAQDFVKPYEDALANATEEAELRNIMKNAGRDHNLTVGQKDAVIGLGRSFIRKLSAPVEHYGKGGLTVTPGGNADAPRAPLKPDDNPPPGVAPLGHALKDLVEAEVEGGEPAKLIVREPALPVIDPARLGVAMKMWQQLARVIEENTPECITIIQGKGFRNSEFWRAARLAYGVDRPSIEHEFADYTNGRATVTVRVSMGRRYASATGIAERAEKGKDNAPMNTLQALAWTRAANRATREVIGLGSKSAEEVEGDGA